MLIAILSIGVLLTSTSAAQAHPGHAIPHQDVIGPDGTLTERPATPEQIASLVDDRPTSAALGGSAPADELAAARTKKLKVRLVGGMGANFDTVKSWLLDPVYGLAARYAASGGRWITFTGRSGPAPDFEVVHGGSDGCVSDSPEIVFDEDYDVTLSIYMGPACGSGGGGSGLGGGGGAMVQLGLQASRSSAIVLASHETGHAVGFSHASEWECSDTSCDVDEYGNATDFMGSDWTNQSMVSEITAMTGDPAYVPAERIVDVRSTTDIRIAGAWPTPGIGTVLVPMQVRSEPEESWNDDGSTTSVSGIMSNGLAIEWQPVTEMQYDWGTGMYNRVALGSAGVSVRQIPFDFDPGLGITMSVVGTTWAFPGLLLPGQTLTIPKRIAADPSANSVSLAEWNDPSEFRITVLQADDAGATVRIEMPTMPQRTTRTIREHTGTTAKPRPAVSVTIPRSPRLRVGAGRRPATIMVVVSTRQQARITALLMGRGVNVRRDTTTLRTRAGRRARLIIKIPKTSAAYGQYLKSRHGAVTIFKVKLRTQINGRIRSQIVTLRIKRP